jgi:threonine/homoserine/homoserine lactone efflux protein
MTTPHALLAFLIASSLLTITPGLDTALVLRSAATGPARRAIAASAGICLGLLGWGLAASVGLGALLAASRIAYNLLRLAGACYLIYLGVKLFFRSAASSASAITTATAQLSEAQLDHPDDFLPEATPAADPSGPPSSASALFDESPRRWFLRGLLTNLLNPKVGVFYVTFLPLFIPAHLNVILFSMLLASIHILEGVVWFALIITAVRPLSHWLRNTRVAKSVDRLTGAVFVAFGLRLLLSPRR